MPRVFQEVRGCGVPFYADHMRSHTEIFDSVFGLVETLISAARHITALTEY
jgi:hypothetical protein